MGEDRVELREPVARERIAHLDRRRQVLGPLPQHVGQVFSGVPPTGKIQRHRVRPGLCQDVRRERPRAVGRRQQRQRIRRGPIRPPQIQDPHGGVVMVQQG